ncbi:MAG: hypothetical protein SNJ78_01095 [Spirochaetales bacterium]
MLTSCQLFSPAEKVELALPDFPYAWMGEESPIAYRILFFSDEREKERWVSYSERTVTLTLPLGRRVPVILYPLFEEKNREGMPHLYPAGSLYPDLLDKGKLKARWIDGFAAECLFLLARGGFELDGFNCARFIEEVRKRGDPNPWSLDRKKITDTLAGGSFRADRIVKKKSFSVTLPLSPGIWFGENLLLPPLNVTDEAPFTWEASIGTYRFWKDNQVLTFTLTEKGALVVSESYYGLAPCARIQ